MRLIGSNTGDIWYVIQVVLILYDKKVRQQGEKISTYESISIYESFLNDDDRVVGPCWNKASKERLARETGLSQDFPR